MDYSRGDPTQLIDRELINRLRDLGYAEGGEVNEGTIDDLLDGLYKGND
jgi:hypothetical protein